MSAFNFQEIIKRFEAATMAANQANEKRYQEILGLLAGQGKAASRRIDQQATRAFGAADQDLTTRGLGNTTIRESVRRGVASDAELAQQSVDEQVAGMKAGVIERRNDIGPDMSMMAGLIQAAAAQGDPNKKLNVQVPRGMPAGPIGGGGGGGGGLIGQTGLIQPGGGGGGGGTGASIVTNPTGAVAPAAPQTGGGGAGVPALPRATGGTGSISATNDPWAYKTGADGKLYRGPKSGYGSWTLVR